MKKLFVLLSAAILAGGAVKAQEVRKCGTDENRQFMLKRDPNLLKVEAQLEKEISERIASQSLNQFASKGTQYEDDSANATIYHVPVVFHVVHDYGDENVTDSQLHAVLADMNAFYSRTNPDSVVIAPFAGNVPGTNFKYRGKANIRFHLATRDPLGNPTDGIVRRQSFATNGGGDNSKFDQWAPDSYMNIWFIHTFSGSHTGAAAYAEPPASAVSNPYGDGVISIVQPPNNGINTDHTVSHELGHEFNLIHPFGLGDLVNNSSVPCGDDAVDDTPPTRGHKACNAADLMDTLCANGYFKTYTPNQSAAQFNGDPTHLYVDYPDTANTQNVMDYSYCSRMFTRGQVIRMRAALQSTTGGRSHLIDSTNLVYTGALLPTPSLMPVADFSPIITTVPGASGYTYRRNSFICADGITTTSLKDFSYRGPISSYNWSLSNGASQPNATTKDVNNVTFTQPGWVTVSENVTSSIGSNTLTRQNVLYAADPAPVTDPMYRMSFNNDSETAKWPVFNYYDGTHKWEVINTAGYNDNTSIRFFNKDARPTPYTTLDYYSQATGTYDGDYAEFFSRAYDLSNAGADTKLSFAYAGAYRTTMPTEMNDKLEVAYSIDCGKRWTTISTLTKGTLGNNGYITADFAPTSTNSWSWYGIPLANIAGNDKVYFKFRYTVGSGDIYSQRGTGNNFYMDMIGVNDYALGVTTAKLDADGIVLSPNPTSGAATITIKGGDNTAAIVHVTDVTGKLVYSTDARLNATATKVEIPADRIAVKGIYMVQVITNGKVLTQKLSVY